jgi:NAD(P)H-flavin reductase
MLKAVSAVSVSKGITAYISMEEHMACGLGACLGCVVKTTGGYKRVCKEGPVFNAEEIVW